jgi:hypothetical protein
LTSLFDLRVPGATIALGASVATPFPFSSLHSFSSQNRTVGVT